MLPSKTIPEASGRKSRMKAKGKQAAPRPSKKKARCAPIEMEEVEDEDSARNLAARKAPVNEAGAGHQDKRKVCCFRLSSEHAIDEFKDGHGHQKKSHLFVL